MKILICSSFFEYNGNGTVHLPRYCLQIPELTEGKHEVMLLSEDLLENKIYPSNIKKVETTYPRIFHFFGTILRNWSYYRAAAKLHKSKEFEFDVIVFNRGVHGILASLLFPSKIKVIGWINDDLATDYQRDNHDTVGGAFYYWLEGKFLMPLLFRYAYKNVVISEKISSHIIKRYAIAPSRLAKIYLSVNVKKYTFSPPLPIDTIKPIKVIFVKQDIVRGRLHDLAMALTLCSYDFELTIIGPSLSEKEIILAHLPFSKNLTYSFLGKKTHQEVGQELYRHHILCIPARAEALGLANVEGLAHGISVVATNQCRWYSRSNERW